ncbi:MAG TPA: bifunctional DNA primase/polymerase [Gemmataceae bacterium]
MSVSAQPGGGNLSDSAGDYHRQRIADGTACLEAALRYLKMGWSVLALCPCDHVGVGLVNSNHAKTCKNPGKVPWWSWTEWQDRLPTEKDVRYWWQRLPNSNVGMTLGGITGLIGADVDEDGGEELLRRLSANDVPSTLEFISGKGRRLLYRVPPGVVLRPTPKPGGLVVESGELRLLGLGSQTVMPPSRHKDSGRRYAWIPGHGPGEIEPAVAPDWIIELMRKDRTDGKAPGRHAPVLADGEIIPLHHRDTTLASLAGTMRRRGMSREAIEAALLVTNAQQCDPPLDDAQVAKIAASVGRYAPADVPSTPPARCRRGTLTLSVAWRADT